MGPTFFVTCAFIITIFLNPHLNNKLSKLCGELNVVSTVTHVEDCKVALKDISSSDAVKLKMLNTSQENTHITSSHLTKEKRLLDRLRVKTPIAWGKENDKPWVQLDVVSRQLNVVTP